MDTHIISFGEFKIQLHGEYTLQQLKDLIQSLEEENTRLEDQIKEVFKPDDTYR